MISSKRLILTNDWTPKSKRFTVTEIQTNENLQPMNIQELLLQIPTTTKNVTILYTFTHALEPWTLLDVSLQMSGTD